MQAPFLERRRALLALAASLAPRVPGALLPAALVPAAWLPAARAADDDDPEALYAALASLPVTTLSQPGGRVRVVFQEDAGALDRNAVLGWIRMAAQAVTAYFGRFPVADFGLLVQAQPGEAVGHATTYGEQGAATRIRVGVHATARAFAEDWILVHEMVHTALPDLPRRALWLQEGNATWVEPVARALVGQLSVEEVWKEAAQGMPKGMPAAAEGGMDGTHRWGRLYWGGATFWLMAEIAIDRESQGRQSLRDALRGINRDSGGNHVEWTPEQLMQSGDRATGTSALASLYTRFSETAVRPDLDALFVQLGVNLGPGGAVQFNDAAPLAGLRQHITRL